MKISSLFLSTASAGLFLPQQGTDPVVLNVADAEQYCKDNFDGSLANPSNYPTEEVIVIIYIFEKNCYSFFFTIFQS